MRLATSPGAALESDGSHLGSPVQDRWCGPCAWLEPNRTATVVAGWPPGDGVSPSPADPALGPRHRAGDRHRDSEPPQFSRVCRAAGSPRVSARVPGGRCWPRGRCYPLLWTSPAPAAMIRNRTRCFHGPVRVTPTSPSKRLYRASPGRTEPGRAGSGRPRRGRVRCARENLLGMPDDV